MISFFRKIRKQYANDNKPLKYMRYAIGEIVLVVIGILIAIQVNNWNEKRKTEKQFEVTLDRLYTSIKVDLDMLYYYQNSFKDQLAMIDEILENSDNIESQLLINTQAPVGLCLRSNRCLMSRSFSCHKIKVPASRWICRR